MLRATGARTLVTLALTLLAGCALRPAPLTENDTAERVAEDRRALAAHPPALDEPLTLHGAMAHALLFNLERRVRAMEQALALGELEASRLGLLPGLSAGVGVATRSNVRASSSRTLECPVPIRPCPASSASRPSTSSDQTTRTATLSAVWHVLDFGVSYYAARQHSDRVLIAHERRRKSAQTLLAQVRRAWWRAAAAERAMRTVAPLMERVREALADSARIAELRVRAPLETLRYRRALLRALETLEAHRREGRRIRLELAELMGLGPGRDYRIAPAPAPAPRQLRLDIATLETVALRQRPELREAQLSERIAAAEVRKALVRVLPGVELSARAHTDSNSYLVNQRWASLGAQVSLNLSQLFTAPAAMAAARAGHTLERARREALAMAVLTQLHIALAGFEEARAQHATARLIAETQDAIVTQLRSGARLAVMNELEAVLAELEAVRTALRRDLAYAEVEDGFGRIFAAAGADVVTDGTAAPTPAALAAAIAATESAWSLGDIAMQAYPEESPQWGKHQNPWGQSTERPPHGHRVGREYGSEAREPRPGSRLPSLLDPTDFGASADVRARGLLTHEADGFGERGLSGTLAWGPAPSTALGPSLTLSQTVGAAASGGAEALLGRGTMAGLPAAEGGAREHRRLEATLGYGLALFGGRYTGTPELGLGLGLGLSDASREYRLGWRLAEARRTGLVFGLDVEGARRERAPGEAEHRLGLGLGWRLEGAGTERFELRLEAARLDGASDDAGHRLGLTVSAQW